VFGKNAALNIGGSFVGTTASSIKFSDGVEFSAVNPTATPLLKMSVPIGLQMGQNSGAITVQGLGHKITGGYFTPIDRSNNPIGLQVRAGNTLALIGGAVNFSGGIAAVDGGGHLEIGSVSNGQVRLNPVGQGWVGDYSVVSQFNDIQLAQQSLLDASGSNSSIQLQGRNIRLTEGSFAFIQNLGVQSDGGITVNATESLNLTGNTSDGLLRSFIGIENLGGSPSGNITISAAQLSLQDGGAISSRTYTPANSGNVTVNVAGTIDIDGVVPTNPTNTSTIATSTLGIGNAGNITISAGNLRILNSGNISSATTSFGQAGKIQINAEDSIEVAGANPITLSSSAVVASSLGAGNANDLVINTSRLLIRDSGSLGSTALATGSIGNVTVNASESVEVTGRAVGLKLPSRLLAAIEIVDPVTQAILRTPPIPSGNSGSIKINTPSLRITNEGTVTVRNEGPGTAGNMQINANSIVLDNQGSLTASTASGNGGDIRLNLQENLLIRDNSLISATSTGKGNGGNLSINAPVIVGLKNSDIIANAVNGKGGNIDITTQGLFGIEYRPQRTPGSDITASSQFGVNGTVQVNNVGVDPNSGLVELPENITDQSQQIATGCSANQGSTFVATGRGGIPQNPNQELRSDHTWSDIRDISAYRKNSSVTAQILTTPQTLFQATSWHRNSQGKIELVADKSSTQAQQALTCAAIPQK
jgi:large exoprotein involved in heme utilization and adhesion